MCGCYNQTVILTINRCMLIRSAKFYCMDAVSDFQSYVMPLAAEILTYLVYYRIIT